MFKTPKHYIPVTQAARKVKWLLKAVKKYKECFICHLAQCALLFVFSVHTRLQRLWFSTNGISSIPQQPLQVFSNVPYVRGTFGKRNGCPSLRCVCDLPLKRHHRAASLPFPPAHTRERYKPRGPSPSALNLLGNTSKGISWKWKGTNGPGGFKSENNASAISAFHSYFSMSGEVEPQSWYGSAHSLAVVTIPRVKRNSLSQRSSPDTISRAFPSRVPLS